jgi:hypothetical protein
LVLPVLAAGTGAGVSSTCKVSEAITSAAKASRSGCRAAAVAPTQPDKVEVSRSTPSRAKISACRYNGRSSSYLET